MTILVPKFMTVQYKARYGSPFVAADVTIESAVLAWQQKVRNCNDAARLAIHVSNRYHRELLDAMDSRPVVEDAWVLVHRGSLERGIPTLWLLGWAETHGTDVHDHAESEVGLTVLRGRLIENVYDLSGHKTRSRQLRMGETIAAGSPYIHDVFGTARSVSTPDVSLHAYWPPLRTQTLFKPEGDHLVQTGCWKDDDFSTQQCASYQLLGDNHA